MEETLPEDTGKEETTGVGEGDETSNPSSPEFEFWGVCKPTSSPSELPSADELFTDGIILPLHQVRALPAAEPRLNPEPEPEPAGLTISVSKRWTDIFKGPSREKKPGEKEARRAPRSSSGGGAEVNININIWPFSRSRSAGTGSGRSRGVSASARRVSSAPCSRSNSRGETGAARRWAGSPGRPGAGGVHVGRASPVWQPRRPMKKATPELAAGGALKGAGLKVASQSGNLVVRSQGPRCGVEEKRSLEKGGEFVVPPAGNSGHFTSLRAFFSKVF
ncbi:uncharacterized protein LOC144705752 [Wolffia australiana]